MANPYFAFRRVDNFEEDRNRKDCYDVRYMDGVSKNFKIVLASDCPSNIEDCLDEDGTLNDSVQIIYTFGETDGLISLLWSRGVNSERAISVVDTSVSYDLADEETYVKALFLVSYANGSGYVMAYSINNVAIIVPDDQLILNVDGMIWATRHGE